MLTDAGAVTVAVRDRAGSFEPKLAPEHTRRLQDCHEQILSL
ncbi:transposase [Streptomyces sp. NPDC056149]